MTPSFLLFLKLAYLSIAHAIGKALWSLRTRFWSHVRLQACICNGTKRCSIPRRLGRKHMQALALQVHVTDGAQLAKVRSKQHPRVFPVDSHLLRKSARLWSSSTSSPQSWPWEHTCVHLCSDTFHRFGISSSVQPEGLHVLRHSASLL